MINLLNMTKLPYLLFVLYTMLKCVKFHYQWLMIEDFQRKDVGHLFLVKNSEQAHDESLRRQAEADILGARPLPCILKYFASWINGVNQAPQEISAFIKFD